MSASIAPITRDIANKRLNSADPGDEEDAEGHSALQTREASRCLVTVYFRLTRANHRAMALDIR